MLANVRYRGLAVAEGTRIVRSDDDALGPFIELDPPFPVGTTLAVELVREGNVEARTVKVKRVHEGLPAGIFVHFTDGAALPKDLPSRPQAALAAAADEPKADAKNEPKTEPNLPAITSASERPATVILEAPPEPIVEKVTSAKAEPPVAAAEPEPSRRRRKTTPPPSAAPTVETAAAALENSDTPADERRARLTEPVPVYAQQSFPDVGPRDTVPSMPAYSDLPPERVRSDTIETPIVSMEAEPEDEPTATTTNKPTDNNDRRGGRKRKRSKTVLGH